MCYVLCVMCYVPAENALFELTITIPGFMQPIVEILNKKYDTIDILKSTALADAGITTGSAKIKLTHRYTSTAAAGAQAQAMQTFQAKWNAANGGSSVPIGGPAPEAPSAGSAGSSGGAAAVAASASGDAKTDAADSNKPYDRKRKIWLAASDQIRPTDCMTPSRHCLMSAASLGM